MQYELTHQQLGKIIVTPHSRAKRIIARRKKDHIQLTVPVGITRNHILSTIERLKPQLLQLPLSKAPKTTTVAESDIIQTHTFTAYIGRHALVDKIAVSFKNGKLLVSFPQESDIASENNQHFVRKAIVWGLRREAKRILPKKTKQFAEKFNLSFDTVKINSGKTRWGSCSGGKNINYSLYLLLLPEKFIDYVVLHELAHTVEMNHSDRFWALLDRFSNNQAKALAKELKAYKHEWRDFLMC